MNCALLVLTLLAAEEETAVAPAPEAEVSAPAPEPAAPAPQDPDEWPGEGRRVHYGIGARVHTGVLESINVPRLLWQSEFTFFVSIRVFGHHEWRVGVGIAAGWPDTVAGETNVSFRFHLSPRLSVGAGLFTYWGFWSMRGGLEVPVAIRLGPTRRHEIHLTARAAGGAYNNTVSFVWYDFKALRPAWSFDVSVGYSAIF